MSGLVVQLSGRRAYPAELIRSRRAVGGHTELLIRWRLVSADDEGQGGGATEDSVLMWMSEEDARFSCPDLHPRTTSEDPESSPEQAQDQREHLELQQDVRSLVARAQRQVKASVRSPALSHTVSVLCSYAAIAALASVFRETGALDLILELLCDQDRETRRSAGQILRALASHDAGSRASVLLALAHRDLELDFENRLTLLELFAETTSTEEHICFEHTHLPQIPGKSLFSLVKHYLRVTSLVDSAPSLDTGLAPCSDPWLRREFEVAMATAALTSELVRVLGWDRTSILTQPTKTRKSIFKPTCSQSEYSAAGQSERSSLCQTQHSPSTPQKEFRTSEDFQNWSEYETYLQQELRPGMRVRMNQGYEEVSAGDQGEFRTSNSGSPPVQVYWDSLGRTYWVHWHMLDIVSSESNTKVQTKNQSKDQSKNQTKNQTEPEPREARLNSALRLTEPQLLLKPSLYTCPYLSADEQQGAELSLGEWWELLFFVRKLERRDQDEARAMLQRELQEVELDESSLIGLSVPVTAATQLLHFLEQKLAPPSLRELQRAHCFYKLSTEAEKHQPRGGACSKPCPTDVSVESASKKPKKETVSQTESEITPELEQTLSVFEKRVPRRRSVLEKLSEAVEVLQKERETQGPGAEQRLQLGAVVFMNRTLEQDTQDRDKNHADSNTRSRVLKLLVDLMSSDSEVLVWSSLSLVCGLLLRFDWRESFCTEGGARAVLTAMRQFSSSHRLQRRALETLQLITGVGSISSLPEGGAPLVREVFASISSATPKGTRGLLGAIPAAITLLLQQNGSQDVSHTDLDSVRTGLLVLAWLVSHRGLKESLESCDLSLALRRCISEGVHSALALSVLRSADPDVDLDLLDSQVQTLLSGLKEPAASKEVIRTLEKVLCDSEPQEGTVCSKQMTQNAKVLLDVLSLLEMHKSDKATLLSLLRILGKFLDSFEQDFPWHEAIEPCLSCINLHLSDPKVLQAFVGLLLRLGSLDKDLAVLMVRLRTGLVLERVLEKHSSLQAASELKDLLKDLDKHSGLFQTLASSLLGGCIQLVLGQIEEHRRSHRPINIPLFDVFLTNLCSGSGVDLKEDQCWEKVEVSSNQHRAKNLTDNNPKTYWESNGCTGSHYISLHLNKGVAIRELAVLLSPDDSSYMPARIVVYGGDDPSNISTELSTVNVAPSASRVVLLQNQTQFWPIVQIRIKRCQQGGIDTRVHGFEILGPTPTFWPVFRDQLCLRTQLFYSSKAHGWSQRVRPGQDQDQNQGQNQLLSLYNRLNTVLKLEQSFADQFLPDSEAASALGQTVWDALVCPLVHAITSSECPALASLLSQYLENSKRRCKSRAAIFNSRVRRLVHLLVHVDTGPIPELQPAGKESKIYLGSKPKLRSSSISDMALCWQGVVQQQVRVFLEAHLAEEDFSERYSGLHQSLLRSTTELFHKHQAFVLALRQGFSSALLGLSVSQGITVCERFAWYIGHLISQVTSPGGKGEESAEKLQRFLEPTLFLCGLELASSFEHFYRRYLGERLLLIGQLWLESAVIGQIGACFPGRLPQQMIQNLRESEDLQREFSLHRLHMLDQDLDQDQEFEQDQHVDQDLDSDQHKEYSDQTLEVQVLVLSPRCWTISSQVYLDQSRLRSLPKNLLETLHQYQDFYQLYQAGTSQTSPSPRRLQWTWLGRAEVQFGAWTLSVSTAQMFILLQFNHSQVLTLDSLVDKTGLPEPVLIHSLQPLTGAEGPLAYRDLDQNQPVLQLDPEVALRSQDSTAHVRLVPDQDYRSMHKDAAAVLERKRNFLLCVIVRIMKRERELHIDHLVYKVLDFCQKQSSSGPGPSPEPGPSSDPSSGPTPFSCSSADVLSCLMLLLSKNCVRRKPDRPQILDYVSEVQPGPARGQAIDYSHAETSLALDDLSLDSGRTMTQDQVRELMKETIQQVSVALSLEDDWAEHLLVLNKWNVDRVVQRFTEDPDSLLLETGLKVPNPAPCGSEPATCLTESPWSCPVCLCPGEEGTPSLSCGHYCCQSCWQEYLTSRIEQNLALSCNCPITDCTAQPTPSLYRRVLGGQDALAKYEGALLRGFVDACSNLTWCTNPSGCDQVLLRQSLGDAGSCSQCGWASCFSCTFPEAHFPCSCAHVRRWVDDGGFYEGMSVEAQSKHLAKLISKRCPQCSTAIEKNEGCLHMTCAKCNHGFCWRCLKPWKPNHKDYYNCSASVSRAARQGKKFQDFNEKCTFHHRAKDFALGLVQRVSTLSDSIPMRALSFVMESCRVLVQSRKVLAYSCVYSYYTQIQNQVQSRDQDQSQEQLDLMEQQTDVLELHTTALQLLLEETLLQSSDLVCSLRLMKPDQICYGLELVQRVLQRLKAILHHSTQDFRVGCESRSQPEQPETEPANHSETKRSKSDSDSESDQDQDRAEDDEDYEDEEYVPEWNEEYEDEDLDEEYYSDYDPDYDQDLDEDYSPYD